MKKILSFLLCVALLCTTLFALSSCGDKDIQIAIPNDPPTALAPFCSSRRRG